MNLAKIPFKLIASLAEQSIAFRTFIRKAHFKGKVVAVSCIDSRFLPKTEIIEECNGLKYALDLQDDIQKFIYFNVYERRDIKRVLELVREGGVCLDVGANVGGYALNFAKRVGRNGKVYAFEASPSVAQKLRRNIALNGYESIIEVEEWAVSDKKGKVSFAVSPEGNSGWGHIGEDERFSKTISVDTNTLDYFFEHKNIHSVDLMKVDIEGAEDKLIEGAQKVLSEKRIKHIYMEFCKMSGEEVKGRINRLQHFGYFPEKDDSRVLEKMQMDSRFSKNIVKNFLFSCVRR